MDTLRSFLDTASGYAEALFDPDDEMYPHFVAQDAEGGITVAALALGGRELDLMRKAMTLKFERDGFRRWIFFSEGWMVESQSGPRGCDPQDDPERVEVVLFDAFDVAGHRRLRASRQILRREAEPVRLMPLVISRGPVADFPTRTAKVRA